MRREDEGQQRGQAFGEYAILVAGIAIVCVFTILFLSGAITGHFKSSGDQQPGGGAFNPPVPRSDLTWPTSSDECEGGRWQNFVQFANETECKNYVDSLTP